MSSRIFEPSQVFLSIGGAEIKDCGDDASIGYGPGGLLLLPRGKPDKRKLRRYRRKRGRASRATVCVTVIRNEANIAKHLEFETINLLPPQEV